jgi:hypothetical protein
LVWSLLSDWCNFGGIPLAAWALGENPLCGRSPTSPFAEIIAWVLKRAGKWT